MKVKHNNVRILCVFVANDIIQTLLKSVMTTAARRALGRLALCALLFAAASAAEGAEKILLFRSDVLVRSDGVMTVRETIKVRAEGVEIKRGIYRDFPTRYTDRRGQRTVVGFTVLGVERDGRPEAYHTEDRDNGKRVYIGKKDVFLKPGEYTYTLSYETDRQIGYFPDHDELYWNVTGNGWTFPIEKATALVTLPAGLRGANLKLEAYTGAQGAKDRDYIARVDEGGSAWFATTRPLLPRHGLTIVVSWPKGFVAPPAAPERTRYFLRDNAGVLIGLLGIASVFGYYMVIWTRYGRDPATGTVIPLFTPPANLSPAALRYVTRMGFDHNAFAASVVNMAVKGYLKITETGNGEYVLTRQGRAEAVALAPEERRLGERLFGKRTTLALETANHATIAGAISELKKSLHAGYRRQYFARNGAYLVPGLLVSFAFLVASGISDAKDIGGFIGITFWLTIWTFVVIFLWTNALRIWRGGKVLTAIPPTFMALAFTGGEVAGMFLFSQVASPWTLLLLLALVGLSYLFFHLLRAPTVLGRKLLDQIEGFKMYLSVAEQSRLNLLNPPERTPQLFEKYLPYALALGVEQAWAEQFADVLAQARAGEGYVPRWYEGSSRNGSSPRDFASSLGASFIGAISSSAVAPGSSSGGGGGGSSGGGGGGGGGGGW